MRIAFLLEKGNGRVMFGQVQLKCYGHHHRLGCNGKDFPFCYTRKPKPCTHISTAHPTTSDTFSKELKIMVLTSNINPLLHEYFFRRILGWCLRRWALIVYRLVDAAQIRNFFHDPFFKKKIVAKGFIFQTSDTNELNFFLQECFLSTASKHLNSL